MDTALVWIVIFLIWLALYLATHPKSSKSKRSPPKDCCDDLEDEPRKRNW